MSPTLAPPIAVGEAHHERTIVAFATVQLFSLIYLQKFAFMSHSFPLSVPMLVMLGGIGWMVVTNTATVMRRRLAVYLMFVGCCLFSEAFILGSISSAAMMLVLYASLTVNVTLSQNGYLKIMDRFVRLMILPACIMLEQFAYQIITHRTDPLDMDVMLPSSILLQGYNYAGHFPWNSFFVRPQGFFFLEPSFASAFTAAAVIIEITYFRRWSYAILMIGATVLSKGDTGMIMLVIATPFLLARETPPVVVLVMAGLVLSAAGAYAAGVPLPLLNRTAELQYDSSSGAERLLLPAERFAQFASDQSYLIIGAGAGQSMDAQERAGSTDSKLAKQSYSLHEVVMTPWPILKVWNEYGFLSMVAFSAFYLLGIAGNFNVPLKIAVSVIYMFTGGYLLSPIMVEFVMFLCFTFAPRTSE